MSEFVEVNIRDLKGPALNWAVAQAIWAREIKIHPDRSITALFAGTLHCGFYPLSDWDLCGNIVDHFRITVGPNCNAKSGLWKASMSYGKSHLTSLAATPRKAICTVVISGHFGDTVSVPAELLQEVPR
ncbi:phage protein NinX family protein [Halopseudomonas pachastrellae]|nr:phage protein NinX family protein [Halopseudomonas pachastrellae]|tara:strand:- start:2436 stop:2822 length:387 start_codon:yes stop_codon:yes gene_type:complete